MNLEDIRKLAERTAREVNRSADELEREMIQVLEEHERRMSVAREIEATHRRSQFRVVK